MTTLLLILVCIATLIFLSKFFSRISRSRYHQAYTMGQQLAEEYPDLHGRELAHVQSMHEYYFNDVESVNGFYAGYKGEEYKPEGYDPDQDQESETIEEHLSFWQKMNRK